MHKTLRTAASIAASLLMLLSSAPAFAAAPVAGDLVKLADDGNLETTADSAVYYVGADSKRYAFPSSKAYFTWYKDFANVKIITPSEMAALQLAGNITYRPGTRLIKVTTDPKVYAVEPGGTLRPIASEAVALALFGSTWNRQIDDMPDEYFFNYTVGTALDTPTYPSGSIVKRASDNALFLIDGAQKRRISTDAAKASLRVQDGFVRTTSDTLANYADAAEIAGEETAYTDTAQKVTRSDAPTTLSLIAAASNFLPVPGDATLATIKITSGKAVTLQKLAVKLEAISNEPVANDEPTTDDDKGGLIYGNNSQPNFANIRFLDASGTAVMGRQELFMDPALDQSQTLTFIGNVSIPAGGSITLRLKAQANKFLPVKETYKVTLLQSGVLVVDAATGAKITALPAADLATPTLTTLRDALEVTTVANAVSTTLVKGAKNASISGNTFKATTSAPNVIKQIIYTGYINEGEGGDKTFLAGIDGDNGTSTRVNQMTPTVSLYDSKDTFIAGPVPVDLNGKAIFKGLDLHIAAGGTMDLVVHGDISKDVDVEGASNGIFFDVADASQDMIVTDNDGTAVAAYGVEPNGGSKPTVFLTVAAKGTADFAWTGADGNVLVNQEALLGTLTLTATNDSYAVTVLSFHYNGATKVSLGDLRLAYTKADGTATNVKGSFLGNVATFPNLSILATPGKVATIQLYGQIFPRDGGAISGEVLPVVFDPASVLQFSSSSTQQTYDSSSINGSDFKVSKNTASTDTVRYTTLSVKLSSDAPKGTVYRDPKTEVLRFVVGTSVSGGARIMKMTFQLRPSDAGFKTTLNGVDQEANNDALERWANINGDFNDDDGVATLYQIVGSTKTPIGTGGDGTVKYSVAGNGSPSTIPNSTAGQAGAITITLDENQAIGIGPGGIATFALAVDTTAFDASKDWPLTVDLLGGADFTWTDVYSGAPVLISGAAATGLPITNTVSVAK